MIWYARSWTQWTFLCIYVCIMLAHHVRSIIVLTFCVCVIFIVSVCSVFLSFKALNSVTAALLTFMLTFAIQLYGTADDDVTSHVIAWWQIIIHSMNCNFGYCVSLNLLKCSHQNSDAPMSNANMKIENQKSKIKYCFFQHEHKHQHIQYVPIPKQKKSILYNQAAFE